MAAARIFVEARCFLRAYREQVTCIFLDSRVKHGNDKRGMTDNLAEIVLAFPSSSGKRSAFRGSIDVRVKPEHDRKE